MTLHLHALRELKTDFCLLPYAIMRSLTFIFSLGRNYVKSKFKGSLNVYVICMSSLYRLSGHCGKALGPFVYVMRMKHFLPTFFS